MENLHNDMEVKEQYLFLLRKFVAEHGAEYGITRIGIFGSVARGEQQNESDVDILVEFEKPIGVEFIDLSNILEKEFNRKVDVVSLKGIKYKYLKEIEKDIVYA